MSEKNEIGLSFFALFSCHKFLTSVLYILKRLASIFQSQKKKFEVQEKSTAVIIHTREVTFKFEISPDVRNYRMLFAIHFQKGKAIDIFKKNHRVRNKGGSSSINLITQPFINQSGDCKIVYELIGFHVVELVRTVTFTKKIFFERKIYVPIGRIFTSINYTILQSPETRLFSRLQDSCKRINFMENKECFTIRKLIIGFTTAYRIKTPS